MTGTTQQVVVPDIGDVDDVEVIELTVKVGDTVALDDSLIVIESDKASMEIPSPFAGVVASISVGLGDKVSTGQVVAEITASGAHASAEPEAEQPAPAATQQAAPAEPSAAVAAPPAAAPPSAEPQRLEVKLPDVGDAGEVVVIEIDAQPGSEVAAEQMLLVVESDKASMDIVAPAAGQVVEVVVAEGDAVTEGSLLVVLMAAGTPVAVPEASAAEQKVAAPKASATKAAAPAAAAVSPPATVAKTASATDDPSGSQKVYAGPAVRRMARELGVDLSAISGTGARARITKDDICLLYTSPSPRDRG